MRAISVAAILSWRRTWRDRRDCQHAPALPWCACRAVGSHAVGMP